MTDYNPVALPGGDASPLDTLRCDQQFTQVCALPNGHNGPHKSIHTLRREEGYDATIDIQRNHLTLARQQVTQDIFPAVEDALAKHCRGFMDKPTTRDNIAELIERILVTHEREVQQRQLFQRQLEAVDRAVGFPHDDGKGRIELIAELRAQVTALQQEHNVVQCVPRIVHQFEVENLKQQVTALQQEREDIHATRITWQVRAEAAEPDLGVVGQIQAMLRPLPPSPHPSENQKDQK